MALIYRLFSGKLRQIGLVIILSAVIYFVGPKTTVSVSADDTQNSGQPDDIASKQQKIHELQQKLSEIQGQKVSLSSTIAYINTKINLSQAEIDKTQAELAVLEREVNELGTRIGGLEQSLDVLSDVLLDRVTDQYKQEQANPLKILILTHNLSDYYTQTKYTKIVQQKTRTIMKQAENQKDIFDQQKKIKEEKQLEVEQKKKQLATQQRQLSIERAGQQQLLTETQNNETKYQAELQKTLAELEAIQGIIAGKGSESKVRDVNQGESIASIISGSSPCSTGTHLHFEVVKDGTHQNPSSFLSSADIAWNNSPDAAFGFSGDWSWPVNNPARVNQGYGMTYYARVRRAYGGAPHTGIDMVSKTSGDNSVKAVRDGVLFRGGIKCGGNTLQYVRVIHKDNPTISTYYLHVNY